MDAGSQASMSGARIPLRSPFFGDAGTESGATAFSGSSTAPLPEDGGCLPCTPLPERIATGNQPLLHRLDPMNVGLEEDAFLARFRLPGSPMP
jgi:hypothetical protein